MTSSPHAPYCPTLRASRQIADNRQPTTDNCLTDSLTSARIPPGRLSTCRRRTIQFSKIVKRRRPRPKGPTIGLVLQTRVPITRNPQDAQFEDCRRSLQTQHPDPPTNQIGQPATTVPQRSTRPKPKQRRRAFECRLFEFVLWFDCGVLGGGEEKRRTCPDQPLASCFSRKPSCQLPSAKLQHLEPARQAFFSGLNPAATAAGKPFRLNNIPRQAGPCRRLIQPDHKNVGGQSRLPQLPPQFPRGFLR